jgi:hypothetical protein
MSYVEVFQIIFLVVVFAAGLIGFIKAATSDKKNED